MSIRIVARAFIILLSCTVIYPADAQQRTQAELRLEPVTSAAKNAGVWVDGHYVGYVKELKGARRLQLLPGAHEIVVRETWYEDFVQHVFLEPGTVQVLTLSLVKRSIAASPELTAEIKVCVTPARAGVFLDGQYVGHSDEFDGPGQAMLVAPGEHKLTVALPGYLPFETALNLRPHQKLRVTTELTKGPLKMAGPLVSPK
jgi:PEGA domain